MDKTQILEIIQDWNFWSKDLETGIERAEYVEKILEYLNTNIVIALTGSRRSGKTYLIRQTVKKLIESGTNKENILMINFEDSRFTELDTKILDQIYSVYKETLIPKGEIYVFLDEIQNVKSWEKWVRTMHELKKAKIIITGSSSKLLSGELATILTGRHLDIQIFPLDFKEYTEFKNLKIKNKLELIEKREQLNICLKGYMDNGGFPEVFFSKEKKSLLITYFDDIITKDIERRYKIKKTEKLRSLAKFYITNTSNTITYNSLRKYLDLNINTIEKFSKYLEESNILFFIKRFSYKIKEQDRSPRKVYSIDTGLANSVGFKIAPNNGKIAENVIAIKLKKTEKLNPDIKIYYWKNEQHEEVDFVIKENEKIKELIQVCWDVTDNKTKEREIRALLKAKVATNCKELTIITENYEGTEETEWFGIKENIKFIPIIKWLLKNVI